MTDSLVPVVLVIGISTVMAGSLLVLGHLLGKPRNSVVDPTPYECGMKPEEPIEKHSGRSATAVGEAGR